MTRDSYAISELHIASCERVTLSDWQQRICQVTAKKQDEYDKRNNCVSRFETSVDETAKGCYGECGAAQYFNVYWRARIIYEQPDPGDLILPDERVAEVRAREGPRRTGMGVIARDVIESRVYVFTQIELPTVILLGWMEGWRIKQVGIHRDQIGVIEYPCFEVPVTILAKIPELLITRLFRVHSE